MPLMKDKGAYRALWTFDRAEYEAHLKRLPPEDRRSRFQFPISDAQIDAHVAKFIEGGGHVIGWFVEGELRAAAEIAVFEGGQTAEAAFEVEAPWRGRGVGQELVNRALLWARNRGVRTMLIHTTRQNTAMLRAARRVGAQFAFDLADAEGAITAPQASWRSYLREARFEEQGALRWLGEALRRKLCRARGENGAGP